MYTINVAAPSASLSKVPCKSRGYYISASNSSHWHQHQILSIFHTCLQLWNCIIPSTNPKQQHPIVFGHADFHHDTTMNDTVMLSREKTIDYMEKRQEATVLRYMRQIAELEGATGPGGAVSLRMGARDFSTLDNGEIASIMESEQEFLEQRLQRKVESLTGARRWSCPAYNNA
ncbi:hypothetical protein EJF18_30933 [Clavispora lusitaniae]|uniref:Uncharacterized protein n=3 Tax=Clavispora lusitaniae TaxID=36911 RepID=C4Y3X8_CLAL4|nr:uncharacterized protein CLUG_02350 [Clavispora lusitaniae ATCC 42720]KAF5211515.1 hypothetical protein E0198_002830 [Clavispora lusitaniae]EEQ38224.1 predicted protein [Clavispora lusitaniae ATCC 42720]KAF7580372.1 hypothetical protein FOB63_005442 [Clavispora lusitaniae]QFZ27939.1 hypothetical protein EJF14_30933 [Clavispora lusitaniae]QFZ32754.1 hypothetical protein EJF16_30933 [Clavispora lusitaniae]